MLDPKPVTTRIASSFQPHVLLLNGRACKCQCRPRRSRSFVPGRLAEPGTRSAGWIPFFFQGKSPCPDTARSLRTTAPPCGMLGCQQKYEPRGGLHKPFELGWCWGKTVVFWGGHGGLLFRSKLPLSFCHSTCTHGLLVKSDGERSLGHRPPSQNGPIVFMILHVRIWRSRSHY